MWKCKKCGCDEIFRPVSGKFTGIEIKFNKEGFSEETTEMDLDTLRTEFYECPNCCESAKKIEGIANWVEGDKND